MKSFTELMTQFPNNQTILEAVSKTMDHIETHSKIMVSISGGSDSDIVMDLFERIGYERGKVIYVWFDTGLEYEATKRHLVFLEEKYGIEIQRHKAKKPIPMSVKQYGVPFLSKEISERIELLQKHGFQWELDPYESLAKKYPRATSGLKWWCNRKKNKNFQISANAGLKEFMVLHPPNVNFSPVCCKYAKKNVSIELESEFDVDLLVTGERRAEGGQRATKTCYTPANKRCAKFRPVFYFTDADKREYESFCGVTHSDCYTVYGFKRTGCACCPFGSGFEHELEVVKQYEPKLYTAACNIFGPSYEYTRRYRQFKERYKAEKRRHWQIGLFDNPDDLEKEEEHGTTGQ